ncbi:MAG: hypothetical protein IJW54_05350 [Clostridia bacterium]|nr:hypothetical protein [Clostridia bacterium]
MLFIYSMLAFLIVMATIGLVKELYFEMAITMIGVAFFVAIIIIFIYYGRITFTKDSVFVPGLKKKRKLNGINAIQHCINVKYEDIIDIRIVSGKTDDFPIQKYNILEKGEIKLTKLLRTNIELLLKSRERKKILIAGFSRKQRIKIINEIKLRVSQYNDSLNDIDAEQMMNDFYCKK